MSYALKKRRAVRRANIRGHRIKLGALGDSISDDIQGQCSDPDYYNSAAGWFGPCHVLYPDGPPAAPTSQAQQCVNDANTATQPLLAKMIDLKQNWQPTGFFTIAQMNQATAPVFELVRAAQSMLDKAGVATGGQSDLIEANNELFDKLAQYSNYHDAAVQASQTGASVINAPGLKDWVTDTMSAAIDAMTAAYVVSCTTPWWVSALATFQSAFDTVWSVCKRIVGVAITAADIVLTAAETSGSVLKIVAKYGPWALLGAAAYLGIKELGRRGRR